ncbi:exocyst complex component EXO70H1-like [Curcuma longa]|uniref:exocyst complex component EXO70H1-like n=1 Tax=Curcuma longa TaxID=136217 RepID=UPI003D9F7A3F
MRRRGIRGLFSSKPPQHDRRPADRSVSPSRRTFSDTIMEENIVSAEEIISRWGSDVAGSLFSAAGRPDSARFLRAASELHRSMIFFSAPSEESTASREERSAALFRAHDLLAAAMRRLECEMHLLLSAHHFVLNHSRFLRPQYASSSDASDVEDGADAISELDAGDEAVRDLGAVAQTMISAGYGKECVNIYKMMRKSFVEESIYRLGFDRTKAHVQKLDSTALESKIRSWLAVFPVVFKTIFSGERFLCDHVFAGSDSIRESCFADITADIAARLLAFPESVARSKRSPEKLFRLLDLYDAVAEHWPEIETLFAFESTASVRSQAVASLLRLAEVTRSTLADFEAAVQREASRSAVPGGDVHPLTRYVMNYLVFLADYETALADIFADFPFQVPYPLPESLFDSAAVATPPVSTPSSPTSSTVASFEGSPRRSSPSSAAAVAGSVSVRIAWFVLVLLCKLDGKAELYREVSISYLFLANNLHYIVRKVKESRLRILLGDEWAARQAEKANHYMGSYRRLAWAKVAETVPTESEDMTAEEAEGRMRRFNNALEAECKAQAVVTDAGMREQVRDSVVEMIVPAYRLFHGLCRAATVSAAAVRFSPEEVRNMIDGVFMGKNGGGSTHASSGSGSSRGSSASGSAHGSATTGSLGESNPPE